MNVAEKAVRGADRFHQRRRWLAFPYAVVKKFGDDEAGNLAVTEAASFVEIWRQLDGPAQIAAVSYLSGERTAWRSFFSQPETGLWHRLVFCA